MNVVTALDLVSTGAFGCALLFLLRASKDALDAPTKLFFGAATSVYLFVSLSNVAEHAGITSYLDRFEDYAEDLFVPFFLFGLYSLGARRELDRRVAAERELAESRERYRTLVDNVDLGITLVDPGYRILMTNAGQGRLLGVPPATLLGQACHRAFEGRESPCDACAGRVALTTGGPATQDKVVVKPDGRRLVIRQRAFPVPGPDGRPVGFIEVVEDRTARVREETERLQLEGKVLQAQKLESLTALTGGIAHDFNNLLMGVLGNAELARRKLPASSPAAPLLQRIENAALRASDLTRQMTAYSDASVPELTDVDLSRLVADAAPLIQCVASPAATVRLRLAAEMPTTRADTDQLRQVLMAIVINAAESLGDVEGTIEVRTGVIDASEGAQPPGLESDVVSGPCAYFEVADTGPGIRAEAVPRLFDPFYSTKEAGRGLGLPAALGIARGHGGTLRVQSESGRGCRVRLLLPLARWEDAGPPARGTERLLRGRGRRTVIVADDEETVRTVARLTLRELGFAVSVARLASDCVRLVEEHRARLAAVILDVSLPGLEGAAGLEQVRRACPEAALLLSCGRGEHDLAEDAAGQSGAEILHRPYRRSDLVGALARALGGQGDPESPGACLPGH